MRHQLYLLTTFLFTVLCEITAQCPPAGFPAPGGGCSSAPLLCQDIDGYCAEIGSGGGSQPFPGCNNPWELNNDEWFAFFAGTTTIEIEVSPSNCAPGSNQGLQGGIYDDCVFNDMALQCPCTEDPFTLLATNFVIGEIY